MPEDFVGKEVFVFNNLEKVLKFHQNFILPEIESAQKNPEGILNIFKNRKEQFKFHYGKFCSSRNRYSKILVDFREYLKDVQHALEIADTLDSLLLNPVQRFPKIK